LEKFFDLLAKAPSSSGDFQEIDDSGRQHESKVIEDMIVTWWVDQAVREIRIVEVEPIEPGRP